MKNKIITLGAVLYNGFELLDYYGPLEMFSRLRKRVEIVTVAEKQRPVSSSQGPETLAQFDFQTCPPLDLILLPGGFGSLVEENNQEMLNFLKNRAKSAKVIMSVCSGSGLLAKAGLLDGRKATTNKLYFDLITQGKGGVDWISKARWVKDGPFVTSSGVSAGMDMALSVIADLFGDEAARRAADYSEYVWNEDPDNDPFHTLLNKGDLAVASA